MAPRKKRNVTKRTKKNKPAASMSDSEILSTEESPGEGARQDIVIENPEKQSEVLQHKKFGKFRCLLEVNNSLVDDSNIKSDENINIKTEPTTNESTIEKAISENIVLAENTSSEVPATSDSAEMEYKETKDVEFEIASQFSDLKVEEGFLPVLEASIELTEDSIETNIISYQETVENETVLQADSDVCILEEQIPVLGELELINSEGTQDEKIATEVEKPEKCNTNEKAKKPTKKKIKKTKAVLVKEIVKNDDSAKTSKKKIYQPKNKNKKLLDKNHSDTSESSITSSENLIRRSSRIKSISVAKQKVKGQGLVKTKVKPEFKNGDSDTSENSNSGQTDSEKTSNDSPNFLTPRLNSEPDVKPVKVKSRWRRSSELEMGNSANKTVSQNPVEISSLKDDKTAHEDIRTRLKQFVHLKENHYLTSRLSCKVAKKMVCDCNLTPEDIVRGELGCGEDCLNRLLMIECGQFCPVTDNCTNKRFQKSQFSPCEVFRTDKKGLGIRATANIPYGEFILEYIGEVIGPDEFEERATEYSKGKNPHYYFMSLRSDAVIDATQKGNISRFINHSCEPNAETQKWTVNGELRIGFFSRRTILAGEEITFDYQFQRYGKEAQKCFCEAPTCRGWLGEEPDEDEEEEDEEEDEEEEEPKVAEVVTKEITPLPLEMNLDVEEKLEYQVIKTELEEKATESIKVEVAEHKIETKKPPKKEKRKVIKRKVLKDIFDDIDVDEEIEMLMTTGLKNQAHTLKLSRLMVRANQAAQRTSLLRILRRGDLPCRRLFLDYHGLRLIHGWMNDAQQMYKTDKKQQSLRLELLQTLATLPIPNKTMLQDSKVLPTVEKWSVTTEDIIPEIDSESNSPKVETEVLNLSNNTAKETVPKVMKNIFQAMEFEKMYFESDNEDNMEIRRSVGMDVTNTSPNWSPHEDKEKFIQELIDMFEEELDLTPKLSKDIQNYEIEIVALAIKLLEEWATLKEVFRIPKKERIEQMKEHEREADRDYKAGLEHDAEKKNNSRYSRSLRKNKNEEYKKSSKVEERGIPTLPKINKHERRKLFAMQVEHEEGERRMKQRDMWRQHELQCMAMGTDPRFTAPFDPSRNYHCIWNQQTGQWQNFSVPINQNPILNPTMTSRFNSAIHFPYPSMPPPLSTIPVSSNSNLPHPYIQPNMAHPPPNMTPHQSPIMSHVHPPPNMTPHQSPIMSHVHPPPNMTPHQSPIMSHSHLPPNMAPHQSPIMPHAHPPPNMAPHQSPIMPHAHPPPNMAPPQSPIMPHQSPSVPHSLPPVNHPPPVMNIPPPIMNLPHTGSTLVGIPLQLPNMPAMSNPQLSAVNYEKLNEEEDISQVKFAGPIPPPAKLPPKWKSAIDKYGRPYYYHVKIRISQWEPPEFIFPEVEEESSDTTSSSDTSSLSSDTSSEDSDDDLDDTRLLINVHKKIDSLPTTLGPYTEEENKEPSPDAISALEPAKINATDAFEIDNLSSLDERLKEEFNVKKAEISRESPPKRRRLGLVTEIHLISPRSEEDKLHAKENLRKYKENKEKLKRQKDVNVEQTKKRVKVTVKTAKVVQTKKHKSAVKAKLKEVMELNTETAKKIKESFRSVMASVMVGILNPYRKPDCKEGKITNTEDFKHLARKLTHFVMLKELKHCQNIEDLTCTESVKSKAKEFVRKYMSKFGELYTRPKDDLEY